MAAASRTRRGAPEAVHACPVLRSALYGVLLLAAALAGCADIPLVAPDGSQIDLTAASTVIAADGGTTTVSVLLREQDGTFAEDGTQVAFTVSGGEVCVGASESACNWSTIAVAATRGGVANAIVRSGFSSTVTVGARSGSITATKDLTVSSLVAPTGGKMLVAANPDTIAAGSTTQILAFVSAADGSPVPNFTRVVFSTSAGTLGRSIALTQNGFASTSLKTSAAGTDMVTATSGTVLGNATVTVQ